MRMKILRYKFVTILLLVILLIPVDAFAAFTWNERQPIGNSNASWASADSDADGSDLIVGGATGRVYTSSDSGLNWTERQPAGDVSKDWYVVASDADGSNLIVAAYSGRVYTSSDSGLNWTERQPAGNVDTTFFSAASDADGSNLMLGADSGRLYTSSDGGVNWTERQPAGNVDGSWYALASDSDGSNLLAGSFNGRLYTSSDGGVNWTERQPAGNVNQRWYDAGSDSDGSSLIVGATLGRVYTSSDGGVNWTDEQPGGDVNRNWENVESDASGTVLMAAVRGGRLYVSSDSGANWAEEQPAGDLNQNWEAIGSDDDGSNLIAGVMGGRLYTGIAADAVAPTVSTLSPADNATGVSTTANLVITFDEAVDPEAGADNNIVIKKASDDSVIETIDAQDATVTGGGTTVITINPTVTLAEQTAYYVQIGADAFDDAAGNSYAGISNTTSWSFTTGDFTNPTVTTYAPLDNAGGVDIGSDLVITFDEIVDVETGNITIRKVSDGSVVETIAVSSTTGTGTTTITINPITGLDYSTEYYINIDATAFDDVNSNSFAGISDATTWNFVTEGGPVSGSSPRRRVTTVTNVSNVPTVAYHLGITTLKVNSRGDAVKELQKFFNFKLNLDLVVDGIFGLKTKTAVIEFQKLNNLVFDGIVGPLTRAKIQAE